MINKTHSEMPLNTYILLKLTALFNKTILVVSYNWFAAIVVSVIAYFESIHTMLLFLMFSVFIDFISGICKSIKSQTKITSFRLRDTIIKLFLYVFLVMLVYGIQITCLWEIPLTNLVSGFIMMAEVVSIAENIDEISGGSLGLTSFIKKLRNRWLKQNEKEEK